MLQDYEVQPVYTEEALSQIPAREVGTHPEHYDRNFIEGDTVQHFKGGLYIIKGFATNTETEENMVIYQSLKDGKTWARPYDMFISKVDTEKYPDATQPWRLIKVRVYPVKELEV